MRRVGTADLEARLSEHLRPIARVVPFDGEESLLVDPAQGSLADFPWPGPVAGTEGFDIVATLLEERADRS